MANERLTLEIAAAAIGQESIDRLSDSLNKFSAASENAGSVTRRSFTGVSQSADQAHGSLRRLFLAVKDLGEGRRGFAAVEATYFIQSLGGVATAAGFAVVGIAGIAYALHKMNDVVRESGPKMAAAFDGLNGPLRTTNDELRVANDRLRNEIAILEHKPQNTLALALDEARVNADKLADSIRKDVDALDEMLKKQSIGGINAFFTHRASTTGDESEIGEFRKRLAAVDREGLAAVRSAKDQKSQQAAQDEFGKKALGEIDQEIAKFSSLVQQSEFLQRFAKGELTARPSTPPAQARAMQAEIDAYRRKFGPIPLGIADDSARLEERRGVLDNLNEIRDEYSLRTGNSSLQGQKDSLEARKQAAESAKTEISKEAENLKSGFEMQMADLKRSHQVTLGEETSFWSQRLALVQSFGPRYIALQKDIEVKLGDLGQESGRLFERVVKRGEALQKEQQEKAEKWNARLAEIFEENDRVKEEIDQRNKERDVKVINTQTKSAEDAALGTIQVRRSAAHRAGILLAPGASNSERIAAAIAESRKLEQLDRDEMNVRLQAEAERGERIKGLYGEESDEYAAHQDKMVEIAARANDRIYDDQTRTLEAIRAAREADVEKFKSEAGGIFDAITSRQPRALQNLMREQILGMGRTIVENAAGELESRVANVIPHAKQGSRLGKLLQNTPFGPDPLKTSTDLNTVATQQNTLGVQNLSLIIQRLQAISPSGGGGGLPSIDGIAVASAPGGGWNSSRSTPLSGGLIGEDGLPIGNGPSWAGNIDSSVVPHGSISTASKIAGAAAAGAGIYSAVQDFRRGGAGGGLQGAGALAGAAGAVLPLLSSTLSMAGPIGAIAGIGLSLLGGLFNSKQHRIDQINTELGKAQYTAPTALNVMESTGGTFADFGYKGNLRTSNFSPYPQVTEGFTFEQTHGLFGGPPTFYNVPGGQTGQFGPPVAPPPVVIHNYAPGSITTFGPKDFQAHLEANQSKLNDLTARGLRDQHASLAREVSRAAKYS